jgi:hypothetical protein
MRRKKNSEIKTYMAKIKNNVKNPPSQKKINTAKQKRFPKNTTAIICVRPTPPRYGAKKTEIKHIQQKQV